MRLLTIERVSDRSGHLLSAFIRNPFIWAGFIRLGLTMSPLSRKGFTRVAFMRTAFIPVASIHTRFNPLAAVRAAFTCAVSLWATLLLAGCGTRDIRPVEIFPEDNCAHCRMAISSRQFASEIIGAGDEVMKFDDLSCLEAFRKKNPSLKIRAIFVMDYESSQWLPYEKSVIVKTGLDTPMGSGKIAVKDSARAAAIAKDHPPSIGMSDCECCSSD